MTPKTPPSGKTKTMKVVISMDGLRHNLARSYVDLVEMFNDMFKHDLTIDKNELEEKLLALRQGIGVLHCVYDPEREQFSDLSHETAQMDVIRFASTND
jgi:hypothetical protein